MIGLDTNVVVRLFVDDDAAQAGAARRFVASQCSTERPGFVNRVVLCELVWVLTSVFGYGRGAVADVIDDLLATRDFVLEDHKTARSALQTFRNSNVGFSDILVGELNLARGCETTATFDRKAARLKGFVRVS